MPVGSSLNELKDALKTRETNITRALDDLFGDPSTLTADLRAILRSANLTGGLTGDLIDVLQCNVASPVKKRLTDKEIDHLNHWPNKDELRNFLLGRTVTDPHLKFHWELHSKDTEDWIHDPTTTPNQVIFRSPQQNVSFTGLFAGVEKVVGISVAEVKVKVGP